MTPTERNAFWLARLLCVIAKAAARPELEYTGTSTTGATSLRVNRIYVADR